MLNLQRIWPCKFSYPRVNCTTECQGLHNRQLVPCRKWNCYVVCSVFFNNLMRPLRRVHFPFVLTLTLVHVATIADIEVCSCSLCWRRQPALMLQLHCVLPFPRSGLRVVWQLLWQPALLESSQRPLSTLWNCFLLVMLQQCKKVMPPIKYQ